MPSPFESELLRRPPLVVRPYRYNVARLPFPFSAVSEILAREERRLERIDRWQLRARFAVAGGCLALPLVAPASPAFVVPAVYFFGLLLLSLLGDRGMTRIRYAVAATDAVVLCAFAVLYPVSLTLAVVVSAIGASIISAAAYGSAKPALAAGVCWLVVTPLLGQPLGVLIPAIAIASMVAVWVARLLKEQTASRTVESLDRLQDALLAAPA